MPTYEVQWKDVSYLNAKVEADNEQDAMNKVLWGEYKNTEPMGRALYDSIDVTHLQETKED
jgi:hypothetical protein